MKDGANSVISGKAVAAGFGGRSTNCRRRKLEAIARRAFCAQRCYLALHFFAREAVGDI